ncbi:MAG: S-methyl-5-thioribose-1-phosphate isomerase [Candidatus Nanopelagicales bacterium]|nr:S-methyl-5-thioribose-1-phosphate isomerase [Candidatus Nanopelagicales bacterium]
MTEIQAVRWDQESLVLLDQTKLPGQEVDFVAHTVDQVVDAVNRLVVRGAPALGAVGAFGVVVAIDQSSRESWTAERLSQQILRVRNARPTAVNLAWGVDQVQPFVEHGRDKVLAQAHQIVVEDTAANRKLSELGADWILQRTGASKLRVLTHCNTGALATTGWGTALGVIRELHGREALEIVYVDETRPLLQGARLTAWELEREGINYRVQADGAAASTILRGLTDFAIIGADRIARNGDSANKIGSVGVALACQAAGIPFMVAAPSSTVDLDTASGEGIEIELRDGAEVTQLAGVNVAPAGAQGFNPAFDVTPAKYISAIVTEKCVVEPKDSPDVSALVNGGSK